MKSTSNRKRKKSNKNSIDTEKFKSNSTVLKRKLNSVAIEFVQNLIEETEKGTVMNRRNIFRNILRYNQNAFINKLAETARLHYIKQEQEYREQLVVKDDKADNTVKEASKETTETAETITEAPAVLNLPTIPEESSLQSVIAKAKKETERKEKKRPALRVAKGGDNDNKEEEQ